MLRCARLGSSDAVHHLLCAAPLLLRSSGSGETQHVLLAPQSFVVFPSWRRRGRVHPVERWHLLGTPDVTLKSGAYGSIGSRVRHEACLEGPRALIAVVHRARVQKVIFPLWCVAATEGQGHTCCCTKARAHQRPDRATEHAQLGAFCRHASTSEPKRFRSRRTSHRSLFCEEGRMGSRSQCPCRQLRAKDSPAPSPVCAQPRRERRPRSCAVLALPV